MPAFSPTGFTLLNDATVSSPMDVNKLIGEINPTISYFAGDVATISLFPPETDFPNQLPNGYIYPYPISVIQTAGDPYDLPLTYSKLGVFQYFQYTPVNTTVPIQSSSFVAGTPVAPNTKILAAVSYSPTATFQAQIKTDVLIPTGVPRTWLYTQLTVGCDVPQPVTLTLPGGLIFNLNFPTGDSDKFMGGSRSYLRKTEDVFEQNELTLPERFASVLFLQMTNIEGSGFSTSTNVITNPFVECTLTNNNIVQPIGNKIP